MLSHLTLDDLQSLAIHTSRPQITRELWKSLASTIETLDIHRGQQVSAVEAVDSAGLRRALFLDSDHPTELLPSPSLFLPNLTSTGLNVQVGPNVTSIQWPAAEWRTLVKYLRHAPRVQNIVIDNVTATTLAKFLESGKIFLCPSLRWLTLQSSSAHGRMAEVSILPGEQVLRVLNGSLRFDAPVLEKLTLRGVLLEDTFRYSELRSIVHTLEIAEIHWQACDHHHFSSLS